MARQSRLIEPINHATMEDVARAILKKKKTECDKKPPEKDKSSENRSEEKGN